MAKNLPIEIRTTGDGKLAIINGKTYTLLRYYENVGLEGVFFLAVAGRVPLRASDLDDHWQVIRHGNVYLAMSARPFSYHLMAGEGTPTDAPRWPGLRTPAKYYAFVGPTEEAVKTQVRLTLERYHSRLNPERVLDHAVRVSDLCGGPPAYLLKADAL